MALVYKSRNGLTGWNEYALNESTACWYRRLVPFTRTKSIGAPEPWRYVGDDVALELTKQVDPLSPPETISLYGNALTRTRITAKLPRSPRSTSSQHRDG